MINGHGDDLHQFNCEIKYNFSSNVYYKGCSPLLLKELENKVFKIQNYPSPAAEELNILAANYFNLDKNQFLFSNGATEAFYLIAQCFQDKKAIIVGPTFAEYEDACKINKLAHRFISKEEIFNTNFENNLVFICNPNNPDGSILSLNEIEKLLKSFPQAQFIIDEAYYEFTNATKPAIPLINKYSNIAIVRSLTKTFAMPGLRLGYVISNSTFINNLLQLKMPWSVNSLAIASGEFIFNNYKTLSFNIDELLQETAVFKAQINSINYLKVVNGFTTYFLVELQKGTASQLKKYLIEQHQILVRDATNFTGLKGQFIRVSVQHSTANIQLIKALKAWN
ncbi:aminotransferase class I/II-fold pyridoxal phosphate-dependent enzyme [Lutibacter sp. HS1-25]|uniref:pyridoxal phosphate-dependent aminotransferase n=1 Tax=Lutibacter sp. HS1-25 TaxID=2485000 RepID=UPI001012E5A2|nr:aminotransferase class I/II-fold pyridoxal phosphate-dependent enzyme [Lutibacter sp. HS1-25]RXP61339.1 aminotransferase class I/II-fold pyridoxal phosphate-dependent enzyme [Lutibacter sp. HS1-25]